MKYLVIDIETGGLDPESASLLEIGMLWRDRAPEHDDRDNPPTARCVVVPRKGESIMFCPSLLHTHGHMELLKEIGRMQNDPVFDDLFGEHVAVEDAAASGYQWVRCGTTIYCRPEFVRSAFVAMLDDIGVPWRTEKINLAGKCLDRFDLPWLAVHGCFDASGGEPEFKYRRRVLDPGILYAKDDDDAVPDLAQCLRRAGICHDVTHDALSDCYAVDGLLLRLWDHPACETIDNPEYVVP